MLYIMGIIANQFTRFWGIYKIPNDREYAENEIKIIRELEK